MPQASEELRDIIRARFGTLDDGPVAKWLEDQGYKCTPEHYWLPKDGVKNVDEMTQDEFHCLLFLVHEWDQGSLIEQVE